MNESRSLLSMIEERIAAGNYHLPTRTRVATELHELAGDPDFAMERVINLISRCILAIITTANCAMTASSARPCAPRA